MNKLSKNNIKLIYIAAQYRVKAELTKKQAAQITEVPEDLFARAEKKLASIRDKGEIDVYALYKSKFMEFNQQLKNNALVGENDPFTVIIAEGAPMLYELEVKKSSNVKAIAEISVEKNYPVIRSWKEEWLQFYFNNQIQSFNPGSACNHAQLIGAWLKACSGVAIEDLPIAAKPKQPTPDEISQKPYSIIANKARKEVFLIIRDVNHVVENLGVDKVLYLIKETATQLSREFEIGLRLLSNDVRNAILQAQKGPEFLGLNLPLVCLAASPAKPFPRLSRDSKNYPGAGNLNINVSENAMEARIVEFSTDLYKDESFKMDQSWLINEAKQYGLDEKLVTPHLKAILNKISRKQSLESIVIAQGIKSKGAHKPFIKSFYKEAQPELVNKEEKVDLRSTQQRQIVQPGRLIAKVLFTSPAVTGKDVYGNPLPKAKDDSIKVVIGEGVEEKSKRAYYSTCEGVPKVDKNSISVNKMMIHKGDVNLSTGNIIFNGPVQITGNIDTGAIVYAKGDLIIGGSIHNAFVRSGGDIKVHSGITTGEKGLVAAKGNISCEFIENSKIQCGGSILVTKAILNSYLISGGNIKIKNHKDGGIIGGGQISCRKNIITGNLGFKHGIKTEINIGVDWKTELSIKIRSARIEKIKEVQVSDRKELRELMSRNKAQQKTEKNENRKKFYQERLLKARSLLEKMEVHLNNARAGLVFDKSVKIFVHETVFPNLSCFIGGNQVAVPMEVAGVTIIGQRKKGSFVIPIEDGLKMEEEKLKNQEEQDDS